jgi:hypothetical protein
MERLNGIYASTLSLFAPEVQACGRVSRVRQPITLWSRRDQHFFLRMGV